MAYQNLIGEVEAVNSDKDSLIVLSVTEAKTGGVTLEVPEDYPDKYISAGHLIIYDAENHVFQPMPVVKATMKYGSLPAGFAYYGFATHSELTRRPHFGVVLAGKINYKACLYSCEDILSSLKTAFPNIIFHKD